MRTNHQRQWPSPADRDKGPVGTTSGSGGAEYFVPPEEAARAHLTPPAPEAGQGRSPMAAGDEGGPEPALEGSEAGADNPVRGED